MSEKLVGGSSLSECCSARACVRRALTLAPHPSGSIPVSAQGKYARPRMRDLGEKSKAGMLALEVMAGRVGVPALESPKTRHAGAFRGCEAQ